MDTSVVPMTRSRLTVTQRLSFDEPWLRYRRSVTHGLPVWSCTLSFSDYQTKDISSETAVRFAEACTDLRTLDVLSETL